MVKFGELLIYLFKHLFLSNLWSHDSGSGTLPSTGNLKMKKGICRLESAFQAIDSTVS